MEGLPMTFDAIEDTLRTGLAQLVNAELLYQRGRPPRARYIFKHALIQDAAYASLLKSTRQRVHQQIAQRLEAQFPNTVETQPDLLAQHYAAAGRMEPAADYWYKAGQRAVQGSAHVEAIAHLHAGLEALSTLPETSERAQRELDVQIMLGSTWMEHKGYGAEEVEQAFTRAQELCHQLQLDTSPRFFRVLNGLRRNQPRKPVFTGHSRLLAISTPNPWNCAPP
jgi:predicted ATPase